MDACPIQPVEHGFRQNRDWQITRNLITAAISHLGPQIYEGQALTVCKQVQPSLRLTILIMDFDEGRLGLPAAFSQLPERLSLQALKRQRLSEQIGKTQLARTSIESQPSAFLIGLQAPC